MRPRYLEIEGLQSFNELQKIDFDKLGETGLFGIFGSTGSGKSTILDAITLALYGNVQRALRGTQGIINSQCDTLKVSFTFDLLRKNVNRTYTAERVYRRKKDSENSAEAKLARLFEVTEENSKVLADKPGDVTSMVEELLGLQLNDFTRSVVLPQNKFQEFLLLEKARRRDMLERIFYLEEYGRGLLEKVNKRIGQLQIKLSGIEGSLLTLGNMSEKSLVEAEREMQVAKEFREKVNGELKLVETKYNESANLRELVTELEIVLEKESLHLEKVKSHETMKRRYQTAVKAEELKDIIINYKEIKRKLSNTRVLLDQVNKKLPEIKDKLENAKKQHQNCRYKVEKEVPVLVEYKTKLIGAIETEKEVEDIKKKIDLIRKEYLQLKQNITFNEKESSKYKLELLEYEEKIQKHNLNIQKLKVDSYYRKQVQEAAGLEVEIERLAKEKDKRQKLYNQLEQKIKEFEKKLEKAIEQREKLEYDLKEIKNEKNAWESSNSEDRNTILLEKDNYHNINLIYQPLKTKNSEIADLRVEIKNISVQIDAHVKKKFEAESFKNYLERKLEQEKLNNEEIKKLYDQNSAYSLAKKLEEGSPCPVCGSTQHPNPFSGVEIEGFKEIEEKLDQSQEKQTQIEKDLREAENACIKINEQLIGFENRFVQVSKEVELGQEKYNEYLAKLPEDMQHLELEIIEEKINTTMTKNAFKLKKFEEWEEKLEILNKKTLELETIFSQQLVIENGIKYELKVNKENLNQEKDNVGEIIEFVRIATEEYNVYKEKLKIGNAHKELEDISDRDNKLEESSKDLKTLDEAVKNTREILEKLNTERHEQVSRFGVLESDGRNLGIQKEEKEKGLKKITEGRSIQGELNRIEKDISILQQDEKKYFESLKQLEEEFNSVHTERTSLENQNKLYEAERIKQSSYINTVLEEKKFSSIEEAETSILPKEEIMSLEKDIKAFEQIGINIQAQKDMVEKKLKGRYITESQWEDISKDYQAKKEEKENSISLFEGARNHYNNIKNNFELWINLNKKYKESNKKHERLESIQKLLRGNSFIEFISEERLKYIANEASQTLSILTKHRYALELDAEGGFVIRDNLNGGMRRLVSTLSGGETFLTSLSLALALSQQIQLKGLSPLEFFFLDEGFGTLDSNLLDTVIDSLGRLSSSDRIIGLISHVPEVKNRVARRLMVEAPSSEGTGSRVSIEKA